MEYRIEKRVNPNLSRYEKEEIALAEKFGSAVLKEFKDLIKCIVVFGSAARGDANADKKDAKKHDIDVLIVINDLTIELSSEVSQTYRVILERLVVEVSRRLHVQTLKLTNFWDYVRNGDPVAINMLRDGVPLYDTGFFEPIQKLLAEGRIKPSKESIWTYFERAPLTLTSSKWHLLQATLDLYWAVIDASHAALMKHNHIPPSPSHVADMIEKELVAKGLVHQKYSRIMRKFYTLSKMIVRREIKDISGEEYDSYLHEAEDYVEYMRQFVAFSDKKPSINK